MKQTRGCLTRTGIIILSVLFTCSMIELAARVYLRTNDLYLDAWTFRASQPAPYQKSDYFSAAFIAESRANPGGWIYGSDFILPNDFTGTWFNVVNHRRVTTDQPEHYAHTVYLFGGSTVYDSEVPDTLTIASQLQRMLNDTQPDTYRVENLGVTTVTSTQEVARLKTIDLSPGDIVILYHGVNDAVQGIYYGQPAGQMAEGIQRQYEAFPPLQRLRFDLWQQFSPTLDSAALLLYPYSMMLPDTLNNVAPYRQAVRRQYERNLKEVADYTEAAGASLLVMLQPNLFTVTNPTGYEQRLMRNPYLVPPGMDIALAEGYAALREADKPGRWFDMTGLFDGHEGELFLDYCHVTEEGNRLIAAVMVKSLNMGYGRELTVNEMEG